MEDLEPTYPAIIVYDDNSITSYTALTDWTHDVDQWYWSDPGDYLIDSSGRKFVQNAQRGTDERPIEIPTWQFDSDVDEGLVDSLVSAELGDADWDERDQLADAQRRIRHMIDRMVAFTDQRNNGHNTTLDTNA